jgi:TnpA family transposase
VQHPTYKAFAELGKAIKTIFLCQYLHREELRREINEGLNVIEQWNGANDPPRRVGQQSPRGP